MAYIVNLGRTAQFDYVPLNEDVSIESATTKAMLVLDRLTFTVYGIDYGLRDKGTEAAFILQHVKPEVADYLLSNRCCFKGSGAYQNELLKIFTNKAEALEFGRKKVLELRDEILKAWRAKMKGTNKKSKFNIAFDETQEEEIDSEDTLSSSVIDIRQVEDKPKVSSVEAYYHASKFGLVA